MVPLCVQFWGRWSAGLSLVGVRAVRVDFRGYRGSQSFVLHWKESGLWQLRCFSPLGGGKRFCIGPVNVRYTHRHTWRLSWRFNYHICTPCWGTGGSICWTRAGRLGLIYCPTLFGILLKTGENIHINAKMNSSFLFIRPEQFVNRLDFSVLL